MSFGVYAILMPENIIYVGSTISSFATRWHTHRTELEDGLHKNSRLQRAWNKYHQIRFVVLEYCADKTKVRRREQHFINQYKRAKNLHCVNVLPAKPTKAQIKKVFAYADRNKRVRSSGRHTS